MAEDKFLVSINGNKYLLPVVRINSSFSIVVFDMLDNPSIVHDSAAELSTVIDSHIGWNSIDYIVTPECKCIPLAYELARTYEKGMVVLRKSDKLYNPKAFSVEVDSITTDYTQKLYLGQKSYNELQSKRVLLLDDVVSTGESMKAMQTLISTIPGVSISGRACVFSEGGSKPGVLTLGNLPLISHLNKES